MSVQLTTIAPGSQAQAGQIDERLKKFQSLLEITPQRVRDDFDRRMLLSWIHHDSAMEGTVYSPDEMIAAVRGDAAPDPSLVPVYDEIRQNKAAIALCYELAKKKLKVDVDIIKDLYVCLAPDEVDGKKPPSYRKDMPVHRLYLHEIASPEKIIPKLKQFSDWFNAPETRKSTHTVRLAAKAHYYLLQIYPYSKHSGKVARLVMNLILLNGGYTPAIIHATERQRYYDALKTNENSVSQIVRESLIASIDSGIRYFEHFAPPPPPPDPKKRKRVDIGRSAKAKRAEQGGQAPAAGKGLRLASQLAGRAGARVAGGRSTSMSRNTLARAASGASRAPSRALDSRMDASIDSTRPAFSSQPPARSLTSSNSGLQPKSLPQSKSAAPSKLAAPSKTAPAKSVTLTKTSKAPTKPVAKAVANTVTKTVAKTVVKPSSVASKAAPKALVKASAKPSAKSSVKAIAKPSAKPSPKPSAKPSPKPSAKPSAKPKAKPSAKPKKR